MYSIVQCAFITWHIVYANGLLEMLVVCHHLREKRPLHDAHYGRLFLVVGLMKAGREKVELSAEHLLKMGEEERREKEAGGTDRIND